MKRVYYVWAVLVLAASVYCYTLLAPQILNTSPAIRALIMVKNEEVALPRLLNSMTGSLFTGVFICDTGSTDTTLKLAILWSNTTGIPVWIHRTNFTNFEISRNECREAFHDSEDDWVLLLDADFTVRPVHSLSIPQSEVNVIQMHATLPGHPHNSLNLLVRTKIFKEHCRYRLWTHEYLHCENKNNNIFKQERAVNFGFYNDIAVNDHADGKSRPEKLERDVKLLKQWLDTLGSAEKDIRPRALYYLARGYEDLGDIEQAEHYYKQHQNVQNMTNYNFYAYYRLALMEMRKNPVNLTQYEEAMHTAAGAYDGIFRREPLYYLALYYRQKNDYTRCVIYGTAAEHAPPIDHNRSPLFIETNIYDWILDEELGFCLMQKFHFAQALSYFNKIRRHHYDNLDANSQKRIDLYTTECKNRLQ